jgi:hypothetical protein
MAPSRRDGHRLVEESTTPARTPLPAIVSVISIGERCGRSPRRYPCASDTSASARVEGAPGGARSLLRGELAPCRDVHDLNKLLVKDVWGQ